MAKRELSSLTKAPRGRGTDEPNGHLSVQAPGQACRRKNLPAAGGIGGFLAEEQTFLASGLSFSTNLFSSPSPAHVFLESALQSYTTAPDHESRWKATFCSPTETRRGGFSASSLSWKSCILQTVNANTAEDVQLLPATEQNCRAELKNAPDSVHFCTFLTRASSDLILMYSRERATHLLHPKLRTDSCRVCLDLSVSL